MPPRALPVLAFVVLWICQVRLSHPCPVGQEPHYDGNSGYERCCELLRCPKGSVGRICEYGRPNTTSCWTCAPGFFMPDRMFSNVRNECYSKRECELGQIVIEGNAKEDRRCESCDKSQGYYPEYIDKHGDDVSFICHRRDCDAGKQLFVDDSDRSNVEATCVTCPTGTYKAERGFSPCILWTHCDALGLADLRNGSTVKDTTCVPKNMTSPVAATTTMWTPPVGESKQKAKNNLVYIIVPVGLVGAVILVIIVLLIIVRHRQEAKRSRESLSELKKQLRRSNSTSDSEDSLPSKQNEQNSWKLKNGKVPNVPPLDIKKANSGETSLLASTIHTPDSGIAEIYAALTPTFRQSLGTPRPPFMLAHDVVTDSVPEVDEEPAGVNPSSPGCLKGSRSGSTTNGGPSPTDSSGSGQSSKLNKHGSYMSSDFTNRGRHRSGSADLPDVHKNGGREPVVNQYYINSLIYQNGQNCQVNNMLPPQSSFEEDDYIPDSVDNDCSFTPEQESYDYEDDGSIKV